MKNTLRILAMILVAVFWLIGSAVHIWMAYDATTATAQAPSATANVRVEIPEPTTEPAPATEPTNEPAPATRVLLVDASGSMASNIFASVGYDVVVPFSDYLGMKSGDSHIATNIALVLSMGVKEIGVVTDLESYPFEELDSLEGRRFEGVQLTFFLPEQVEEKYVQAYTEVFVNALEYDSSSLTFVKFDGTKDVIFDNYGLEEVERVPATEPAPTTESADSGVVVTIDTNTVIPEHDGCVSKWVAILGSLIYFTVLMALIEVILALCGRCCGCAAPAPTPVAGVPTDVQQALSADAVAADGSGSCAGIYAKICGYCEKLQVSHVWRFADSVEKLTLAKAKACSAGGQTAGYAAVRQIFESGAKTVTIVSDMEFNDKEDLAGVSFDEITFVVPQNSYAQDVIDRLLPLCKTHKVLYL